jgi:hypothetical protein
MAPSKASSCEVDWLDQPMANGHIAAFFLGRAFNRCRFLLRQAFLLFANRVEDAGFAELGSAVEMIEQLAERSGAFANVQSDAFRKALWTIKDRWLKTFGNKEHIWYLGQLEDRVADQWDEWTMTYWLDQMLWVYPTFVTEIRTSLLGVIGNADGELFYLGELLDQGIRPADVELRHGAVQFAGDQAPSKYPESYLAHRCGNVACQVGEHPPSKRWARDLAELLRRIGFDAIAEQLNEPLHDVQDDRLVLVEELSQKIQEALKTWPDEVDQPIARKKYASSNDGGRQCQNDFRTVTRQQAAAIVNRSPRTLERYKKQMPKPRVPGGKGVPAEWAWSELRPWLEEKFKRKLPESFPALRFKG